jgi:hypothetical protein
LNDNFNNVLDRLIRISMGGEARDEFLQMQELDVDEDKGYVCMYVCVAGTRLWGTSLS